MGIRAVVAPEPRLYRYVCWHRSAPTGWVAQVPVKGKQQTVGGIHLTQLGAAESAVSALGKGTTIASLLLKTKSPRFGKKRKVQQCVGKSHFCRSSWQFVYWHQARQQWEARVRKATLGYHDLEMSAAEQVAEYMGLDDVTDIKKSKVSLCSMLKILPSVIAHYKSKVPGDLESGTRHQKESAAMYAWEPGLEVISVQGKYDTFRRKLLSAWTDLKVVSRSSAVQLSYEDRGKRMLPILERATRAMDWDVEGVWSQNCGRGVGRVLGWLPLLSRIGAIAHIKRTGKKKLFSYPAVQPNDVKYCTSGLTVRSTPGCHTEMDVSKRTWHFWLMLETLCHRA